MDVPIGPPARTSHPAVPGWVIALGSCPSTNTWALDHLAELRHGDCVWTEHQTAGRGRDGRIWRSPPGVLTASFVVAVGRRGEARSVPLTRLSLATGLAIIHAISDHVDGSALRMKWPNDVLAHQRKLAGILCETRETAAQTMAVIGIGCNLSPRWEADGASLPLAVGAAAPIGVDELGVPPTPLDLLSGIRRYLLEAVGMLAAGTWEPLLTELRSRDALRDQALRIETGTGLVCGIASGLDDDGALIVRTSDGMRTVASGHVQRLGS